MLLACGVERYQVLAVLARKGLKKASLSAAMPLIKKAVLPGLFDGNGT